MYDASGRLILTDFGLAKTAASPSITSSGAGLGTPAYMAPEQAMGRAVDARADLYALGVIAFQLLTGQLPYWAENSALLMLKQITEPVPDPRAINPALPADIARVVIKSLDKSPDERFQTADEFRAAFQAAVEQAAPSISTRPAPLPAAPARLPVAGPSRPPGAVSDLKTPPEPSLPPTVVDFVGRESELAYYAAQLASKHLAVITGMPGVGKTALASELARRKGKPTHTFWHSFHEGEGVNVLIWKLGAFLAWHDQRDLWDTLQGSTQSASQLPPPEVLMDYLFQMVRGQGYLLCLDDFHHVDDDPLLGKFIERLQPALDAGQVDVILVMQRRPTFVSESDLLPVGGLSQVDMRALLMRRGLTLDDESIAELHASTDGNAQLVMLAIDLLRRSKEPARVISRLGEDEAVERFLVKQVDEGLCDEERSVMSAIAVLMGQAGTRDAIAAVLDGASVRRPLNDLVSRSLLTVVEGESGREYTLNAMVRTYYYDLPNKREQQAMHKRAGEFYESEEPDALRAALHWQAAGEFTRAAQQATANVWAVINRGQARALNLVLMQLEARKLEPEPGARVSIARGEVGTFLRTSEPARQSLQSALDSLAQAPDQPAIHILRARACRGMGNLLEFEAPPQALEWLERGLKELGAADREEQAALLIQMGKVYIALGNYDPALGAFGKSLELLPTGPNPMRARALVNLGTIYSTRGDIQTGNAYALQALEVARQLHDDFQVSGILYNLGFDRFDLNDWPGAAEYLRESLGLAEKLGDVGLQANANNMLGMLYTNLGDYATANVHLSQALKLARDRHLRGDLPYILNSLADLQLRQGQWDVVETSLAEAEQLALEMETKYLQVDLYAYRALARLGQGDLEAALESAQRSLALAREMKLKAEQGKSLRVLGQVLQAKGQTAEAVEAFEQSLTWLSSTPYEAARTQAEWGKCLQSSGDAGRSAALLQEARQVFQELGAQRDLANLAAMKNTFSSH